MSDENYHLDGVDQWLMYPEVEELWGREMALSWEMPEEDSLETEFGYPSELILVQNPDWLLWELELLE